jgi:hypothetical protein
MLEQEKDVCNEFGATLFDKGPLQRQRFLIWHDAEAADFKRPHVRPD